MTGIEEMLKRHEGYKQYAYVCTKGKITIGVGRNIDKNGGLGLSEREIELLLFNDINRVEDELMSSLPWVSNLTAPRFDALVDMCFNLGLPKFLLFKKALNAIMVQDWETASKELLDSRWAKQVGERANELAAIIKTGS